MPETSSIDKNAVARCFGKAAASYDQHAALQRLTSDHLLQYCPVDTCHMAVDLGCGSGALLPYMAGKTKHLIAVDISLGMLQHAQANTLLPTKHSWLAGDAEALPLQSGSIDLCISNLALQWCNNLQAALAEISRCLNPGGYVLFSTLVSGSLGEIAEAWRGVNESKHVNRFLPETDIKTALRQSGMIIEQFHVQLETMHYASVKDVMQSLKGIGANHVHDKRSKITTRTELKAFKENYEKQRNQNGLLPLSYNIAYCLLRKREN
jgi:malonyl-CoA O-methyltransferase